ncbi:DUF4301 family protein [Aquimarina sp. AD10]|uniref:NAD metabolism ATPase/kinase n=1 Tax=Aquimarina aggregata TaxID=1642818 RepID=A0A162ZLD0_9FLAO|nr:MULTISPECIES: DUF4301 family protein [Aquimarina]AXT62198.1 DUF4301 family protein [Aquimarina sp. AD10]KZS39882.1 NAD metabolism ATPase/kinase [Aquimarina aggregata]RKM90607.1 DUF4301 family protein [Aquimarina sp. AD10]
MNITDKDIKLIKSKGLTIDKVLSQVEIFKNGIPFVALRSAATLDNGILKFTEHYQSELTKLYNSRMSNLETIKFVPASGAATRMFKDLFRFLDNYHSEKESLNSYTNHEKANAIRLFLIGLEKFPFYATVMEKIKSAYPKFDSLSEGRQVYIFVEMMLKEKGLNYGDFPKGLLPFHKYTDSIATSFEEHLYEAAGYNTNDKGNSELHFTISKNHLEGFKDEFERIKKKVEEKTNTNFKITYSFQKPETDTIAVTQDNEPFRTEDGTLLFRPGGHGALIENLNDLSADIIYIKNIDNVVVRKYQDEVSGYKKVLAGKLIEIQDEVFRILNAIDQQNPTEAELKDIKKFLVQQLNVRLPFDFDKFSEKYKLQFLRESLNRPIRVCGMVINEGEPGGGPFWVKPENGRLVLQIIEAPQINKEDQRQQDILASSTHFNPVDLVCGVRDYKGNKFNLIDFVDPDAGFITQKTLNGKVLKALELPGLWNGAMSNWISVFVEVPITTFNPVKSVNDLLKSAHQEKLFS